MPKGLYRLAESLNRHASSIRDEDRVNLALLLISHVAELHDLKVAHRDIGEHSVWVEFPDRVSLSGFATSSFPDQNTISEVRNTVS